jgi:DNA invertase Pin-like site-specific DNA recombinase
MDCAADAVLRSHGIGRVSTRDQNPDSQRDTLTAAGCEEIFIGKGASGKLASRPKLDRTLARLRPGDTLVITRLSRAMRSPRHLLGLAAELSELLHRYFSSGHPRCRVARLY